MVTKAVPVVTLAVLSLAMAARAAAAAPAAVAYPARAGAMSLDAREIRAQLIPRRYTTLAAEIGAKISRLPVAEGGRFRQGETLVRLDCSLQQAQLNKAKAALAAAENTWNANQRLDQLHSIGKVELGLSESEVAKARADLAFYAAILDKCTMQAPFAGRVAEQKVREQQYVQPGQALLALIDDSVLELEFIAPSKWLVWLRPGQRFQVAIDETGKRYPARIQRLGAQVDPVSQSIKISAVIDGRFKELMAGMSGKVLIVPPGGQ